MQVYKQAGVQLSFQKMYCIYLLQHSHLSLMLEMGGGCLLHKRLEQGLDPFHLKEEKEQKECSMLVNLMKGNRRQQEHAPMDEIHGSVTYLINRSFKLSMCVITNREMNGKYSLKAEIKDLVQSTCISV